MWRPSETAIEVAKVRAPGAGPEAMVFIVSDSLGETAELVTRAALSQFSGADVEVRRFPMISNPSDIQGIVDEAGRQPTLLVYTLILPEAHQTMTTLCEQRGIVAIDIMGPMMSGFVQVLGRVPRLQPGLIHKMDEAYFRRIECVEFAVKYDDAKDAKGFLLADAVLLGVSRCSKTPVSMYLAHRRYKVANLPLVPEMPLPKELMQIPRERIVGLRVDPMTLSHIRLERVRTMGARDRHYADLERIVLELEYAESVFKRLGCPVVDVTNKAVEETAVRVLELIHRLAPDGRARAHAEPESR